MEKIYVLLKEEFEKRKNIMLFIFVSVFLVGLAAHAYGLLMNSAAHDTLNSFYATSSEDRWKIELGRFIVPYYRSLIRGNLTLPWLIGIIGLFFLSIATYLVIEMFEIRSKTIMLLIVAVMSANVTITAQIATYVYELDFNMLSLLCAVGAAYIWKNYDNWIAITLSAVLVVVSVGIYQSYVAVTITCVILVSIMKLLKCEDEKKVFFKGIKAIVFIVTGYLMYTVLLNVILTMRGLEGASRINPLMFMQTDGNIVIYMVGLMLDTYKVFFGYFSKLYPSIVISALKIAVVMLIVYITVYLVIEKRITLFGKILVVLLVALLPLAMNITYMMSKGISYHDLTTYAFWFVFVAILAVLQWICIGKKSFWKKEVYLCTYVCICVCALTMQNFILSNTCYLKKEVEKEATLSVMTRVVDRIEQYDGYIVNETPVVFVGTPQLASWFGGTDKVGNMVGMYYITPITYDAVNYRLDIYKAYFKYVMNYPIRLCDEKTVAAIKENEYVKNMPHFPDKDSIAMVDGIMVVKMG